MKKIHVMLHIGLLFGLLFATTNVFADAQPGTSVNLSDDRNTFKGTVAAISSESLTLSLANGETIVFIVNSATKIKVPALDSKATLADVKIGAQVKVQAVQTGKEEKEGEEEGEEKDGAWLALSIHVVPGKPEKMHRTGMVTEYVAGVRISILAKDGKAYTFAITPNTKIITSRRANQLGVGARVTINASRETASVDWTVRSVEIHSNPPSTGTKTPVPLTATATSTSLPPTMTNTAAPSTATNTPLPPTMTSTAMLPTATASATSVPPTATATATSVPPTETATATSVPPTATAIPITWNGFVGPLFAAKCTMCHGTSAGVTLSSYQSALSTGSIIPGNPSGSKLVQLQQKGGHFGQLNADELTKVIAWIQAGAPEK
ncbi:MAG: hypothetical protein HYZ49_00825 [Chloroflexi bacterium]|nr:hypothetical protein [Chloroflexota bacterium]